MKLRYSGPTLLILALTGAIIGWAQTPPSTSADIGRPAGQARLELSGQRSLIAGLDTLRLQLFFRADRQREAIDALAVMSQPSGTPLLAVINLDSPRAAALEARFRMTGAEVLRQRELAKVNAFVSRVFGDTAVAFDDRIEVVAFDKGGQATLAELPYEQDRFGLVADLRPQAVLKAGVNKACFSWSCNNFTCNFNASCSTTAQGLLWQHFWLWGDGTASLTPGNVDAASHQYTPPTQYYLVTLNNWYYSGGNEPSVTCCVHAATPIGPPDGLESGVCRTSTTCP